MSLLLDGLAAAFFGRRVTIPDALLARHPELAGVRWRRGGLPPRVGGWCLGQRSVAAITLWRTVFLAPRARLEPWLLLHELAHVRQFEASPWFPADYIWESLRHGYGGNKYEIAANSFAELCLRGAPPPSQDA